MKKISLLCSLLLIVTACRQNAKYQYGIVDVAGTKEITITTFNPTISTIEAVRFCKLETAEQCMIGQVDQLVVDSNLLFVCDKEISNALFVFDRKGTFLNRIGNVGRGPGEYIRIQDFDVDKEQKEVLLLDVYTRKILYYTYNGTYLRTRPVDCIGGEFKVHNHQVVYATDGCANDNKALEGAQYVLVDTLSGHFTPYTDLILLNEELSYNVVPTIQKFQDMIYFSPRFSNTIYQVDRNIVKKIVYLNLENEIPVDKLGKADDNTFLQLCATYSYLDDWIILPHYIYMNLKTPKGSYHILASDTTGQVKSGYFHPFSGNNPLSCFLFQPITGWQNQLVEAVNATSILAQKEFLYSITSKKDSGFSLLNELYENLTENDNPILLFYEITAF